MYDGLLSLGVDISRYKEIQVYFLPLFPRTGIDIDMIRHLINMNGAGDGSIFCLRNSRKDVSVISLTEKKPFQNFNIFSKSRTNKVGLNNLLVKSML